MSRLTLTPCCEDARCCHPSFGPSLVQQLWQARTGLRNSHRLRTALPMVAMLAASQVSTFINLVPLIGVMAAVLLLGEQIQPIQFLGGGVILVRIFLSTRT